jgi:hypothetical protein
LLMKCEERFPVVFDAILSEGVRCLVDGVCELVEWPLLKLAEVLDGASRVDEDLLRKSQCLRTERK